MSFEKQLDDEKITVEKKIPLVFRSNYLRGTLKIKFSKGPLSIRNAIMKPF